MTSIAMFNNKGGVGKTTFVANLASYLALKNYRVVLIDADPQCNSTYYCFSGEEFASVYSSKSRNTIYSFVKTVKQGIGYSDSISIRTIDSFGFSFIAGDPQLALFEDTMASDWKDTVAGDERGIRTTLTFRYLLNELSDYDYVFFDMGPSLGAINRAILLSCDYFITPMSSDIFSILAIENIGKTIVKWRSNLKDGIERCDDTELMDLFKPIPYIYFLGYVTQQYTSKTVEGIKRPVQAYERILSNVPSTMKKEMISTVNRDKDNKLINYELGSIPNFNSIIPLSQSAHKPAFELTSSDGIVGAHFAKVKEFATVMHSIADRMIENLELIK